MLDIHKWKEMSLRLKRLKEEEASLRREICEQVLAGYEMTNGRVTVKDHLDGMEIKAVQTLSYTIDQAVLDVIRNKLDDAEAACVVYKPSLSLATYKKLPEDSLLHEAVITKLAMPTLQAEEYEY